MEDVKVKEAGEMSISTKICSSEIVGTEYIQSSTHGDYHFVNGEVDIEIEINDVSHQAMLQTGHGFEFGDCEMPINDLSVYCDASSSLLYELDCRENLGQEEAGAINDDCETSYSLAQLQKIKEKLSAIISDAQKIIDAAVKEATEEAEA